MPDKPLEHPVPLSRLAFFSAVAQLVRPHHTMTASEAIEICRLKAEELNVPWSSEAAVATRRRVWPFRAFWRVVAHVQCDNLTVTMTVDERSRMAVPIRALFSTPLPARIQPYLVVLFILKLIVSGCLFWLFARYLKGWPIWGATLFAIPCSFAGVMFYEMIVARIRSKDDEDDETDAA